MRRYTGRESLADPRRIRARQRKARSAMDPPHQQAASSTSNSAGKRRQVRGDRLASMHCTAMPAGSGGTSELLAVICETAPRCNRLRQAQRRRHGCTLESISAHYTSGWSLLSRCHRHHCSTCSSSFRRRQLDCRAKIFWDPEPLSSGSSEQDLL